MKINDFSLTYFFIYLLLSYKLKINNKSFQILIVFLIKFLLKKILLLIFKSINYTT